MEVVVDGIIYQLQSRGGISRVFSEILPRMCEIDASLRIGLLTSGRCRQPLPDHPNICHKRIPSARRLFRPARLWGPAPYVAEELVRRLFIRTSRNRIWHSTYYTMPYGLGRVSGSSPCVVTVVDMIYEKFPQYFVNPEQVIGIKTRCIGKADRVIAISNSTKRDILERFDMPEERVAVTYLAASPFFSPLSNSEQGAFRERLGLVRPFLLYVGLRGGYKNFQMLLTAYSKWKRKNGFHLVCVGGAGKWSSEEMGVIAGAALGDSVRLFPDATDEELRGFYSCATAFVYPSLYEGFGIPPLEAMACGTPVIVSGTSSLPEVVGDAGLYFDPSSEEELLAALDRITEDTVLRRELISRGLERNRVFSWQETARKTYNVYRELL